MKNICGPAKLPIMASRNARKLRVDQTEAEARLWLKLRGRRLVDAKFRRQTPVGHYIVDFMCFEAKLIVELDGGQHAVNSVADDERTAWLEGQGFRVLRFWNNDVLDNIEGVVERILMGLSGES